VNIARNHAGICAEPVPSAPPDDATKKQMLAGLRTSARCRFPATFRAHLECTIEVGDVEFPTHCPILGIPLVYGIGNSGGGGKATFDRIDNDRGYVPGNVRIISHRANALKGSMTAETAARIASYMRGEL